MIIKEKESNEVIAEIMNADWDIQDTPQNL